MESFLHDYVVAWPPESTDIYTITYKRGLVVLLPLIALFDSKLH